MDRPYRAKGSNFILSQPSALRWAEYVHAPSGRNKAKRCRSPPKKSGELMFPKRCRSLTAKPASQCFRHPPKGVCCKSRQERKIPSCPRRRASKIPRSYGVSWMSACADMTKFARREASCNTLKRHGMTRVSTFWEICFGQVWSGLFGFPHALDQTTAWRQNLKLEALTLPGVRFLT
jgi:hypothetical protein